MAKINCENRNPKKPLNVEKMRKVTRAVLRMLGKSECAVNVVFVSNQKIRAMNRRYLAMDTSTDVIAFPSGTLPGGEKCFLGDIAISSDKAAGNAKEYGVSELVETVLYLIHGILHLLGYEDKTGGGKARMRKKEKEILDEIKKIT